MVAERFFARNGSLNGILSGLGLGFIQTDLLSNEHQALLAVGLTFVWSMVGTNTIIFLTGIATLDPSLAEAARVDGTNAWQRLIHITLPQLRRFILFASVLTMISAFTALFSLIFVMTGGGPGYGTTTLEFFVYQNAFGQANFGYGALLGVILFVIMAVVGLDPARAAADGGLSDGSATGPDITSDRARRRARRGEPLRRRRQRLRRGVIFAVMALLAVVMLYPFYFMISTSLKTENQFVKAAAASRSRRGRPSAARCRGRTSS